MFTTYDESHKCIIIIVLFLRVYPQYIKGTWTYIILQITFNLIFKSIVNIEYFKRTVPI